MKPHPFVRLSLWHKNTKQVVLQPAGLATNPVNLAAFLRSLLKSSSSLPKLFWTRQTRRRRRTCAWSGEPSRTRWCTYRRPRARSAASCSHRGRAGSPCRSPPWRMRHFRAKHHPLAPAFLPFDGRVRSRRHRAVLVDAGLLGPATRWPTKPHPGQTSRPRHALPGRAPPWSSSSTRHEIVVCQGGMWDSEISSAGGKLHCAARRHQRCHVHWSSEEAVAKLLPPRQTNLGRTKTGPAGALDLEEQQHGGGRAWLVVHPECVPLDCDVWWASSWEGWECWTGASPHAVRSRQSTLLGRVYIYRYT